MGYFITFEGIEGCGKTTQIKLLAKQLASFGYKVVTTREPGGCSIADKIRSILLDADNRGMHAMAELLLYAAARAQHVSEVIVPALKSGKIVLCDRFTDATIAYQSAGRGINRAVIDQLNQLACQSLQPDLTVLIDCDPETGLQRAQSRIEAQQGPREDRFELEALEFHHKVRNGYLNISRQDPKRFLTIDGSGNVKDVSRIIIDNILQRRLQNKNHALL